MKKIWICVVLLLLTAFLLSGCYVQSPSEWLLGRGDPSALPEYTVYLGVYDGNAIPWYVLDNSGGNLLLVSANILDERTYHSTEGATWDESDMRTWLNGEFYNAAFSDVEKAALLGSDKVTLLTQTQAENTEYFNGDDVRIASISGTGSTYWLTDDSGSARCVTDTGAIESTDATYNCGVRPVIRISGSAIAQLIHSIDKLNDGEITSIDESNSSTSLKLALWDDTLPSLSVSGYVLDRDTDGLRVYCTASSALAADEMVYAYFTAIDGTSKYLGCSSLSDGHLTYCGLPGFTFNIQLAVVKPSSTACETYAVGPVSEISETVSLPGILGIEEGGSYAIGQSLDFTAFGANADGFSCSYRWVPESWSVDSQSGTWSDEPYTGSIVFSEAGDYTLTVTFSVLQSGGIGSWSELYKDTRTVSFSVMEFSLDSSFKEMLLNETFDLKVSGLPSGVSDSDVTWTSSDESIVTVDASGKVTAKALGSATVIAEAGGQFDTCTITVVKTPLSISTQDLPEGTLGESYSSTLIASGGDGSYIWYASELPDGLSMDSDTGVISGAPKETGTFSVEVRVYDGEGRNAAKIYSLTVSAPSETGRYEIVPDTDSAYTVSTVNGFTTLTINDGYSGFRYIKVSVNPLVVHQGEETCVFVHIRSGVQIGFNASVADFDVTGNDIAGFNVQPGDIIRVYIVDALSNSPGSNPVLLQ